MLDPFVSNPIVTVFRQRWSDIVCRGSVCFLVDVGLILRHMIQQWRGPHYWGSKLYSVRGTCVTQDTLVGVHSKLKVGGTPPEGRWPWLTHTVLWTQRSKTAKAITSRAKRNLQCTGSRNHRTYLNSCAALHLLRVQPMVKKRKAEVGRRKDIYLCKYLPICLCSSFT